MLNRIKLTNFRRHRELDVTFGAGLSVIRALNEQGKSTLLEAISYAMFGVSAIRNGLDDCVTWGEATNTLKVELELAVDGVVYGIRRSKGGAEVNYDGGSVTGQKEVTSFVARLLKMDAAAAARLTMSNQNEIRGALEAGAKATTELIERLAEFQQIDDLIELMQEELTLGNTSNIESGIASAEKDLERARAALVPVNEKAHAADIAVAEATLATAVLDRDAARVAVEEATEAHTAVRLRVQARADLVTQVAAQSKKLDRLRDQVAEHVPQAAPTDAEIEALEIRAQAASDAQRVLSVYRSFERWAERTADREHVDGTPETLADSITETRNRVRNAEAEISRLKGDKRVLDQKLLHGQCTFCGKDFSGVPEVDAKNAAISAEIAALLVSLAAWESVLVNNEALLGSMLDMQAASAEGNDLLKHSHLIQQVGCTQPPQLKWIGPEGSAEDESPEMLRAAVGPLRRKQREAAAANAAYDSAVAQRQEAKEEFLQLSLRLEGMAEETTEAAHAALQEARQRASDSEAHHSTAARNLDALKSGLAEALRTFQQAKSVAEDAESRLTKLRASLAQVEFNNALLKRVRQVRPLIADKLWNIVLTAVSGYFSEIRGEPSKVTKGADGFEVDGHAVTSMSGSTLDALGLAIRVALVRTFLPSAPFLILDEPAAAMDDDRTNNLLGFIAATGFSQILLVTHEDVSQSVADHIITL
jgi:DNA repair exonuclease SbcCD ATPase subunit